MTTPTSTNEPPGAQPAGGMLEASLARLANEFFAALPGATGATGATPGIVGLGKISETATALPTAPAVPATPAVPTVPMNSSSKLNEDSFGFNVKRWRRKPSNTSISSGPIVVSNGLGRSRRDTR